MKTTRRKELKTNELSVYLQQMYEGLQRHAKYIVGGGVIVILVLAVGWMVQRNRQASIQQAWREYYSLREQNVIKEPGIIEQARALASSGTGDRSLDERALELTGDLAYDLAIITQDGDSEAKRIELLKDAQKTYQKLLDKHGSRQDVAARVRMSLAATEESLAVLDQGSAEDVRRLYQAVIEGDINPFKADARRQLETLDERLKPLKVVATRPAESPETAPAPTTTTTAAPSIPLEVGPESVLTPVTPTRPATQPVEEAPAPPPAEPPSAAPPGAP